MTITCTQKEKEFIKTAFKDSDICPFDNTFGIMCSSNCEACIENRIEWEIKDGEQE